MSGGLVQEEMTSGSRSTSVYVQLEDEIGLSADHAVVGFGG